MIFNVFYSYLCHFSKNENIFATSHVDSATALEYSKYYPNKNNTVFVFRYS